MSYTDLNTNELIQTVLINSKVVDMFTINDKTFSQNWNESERKMVFVIFDASKQPSLREISEKLFRGAKIVSKLFADAALALAQSQKLADKALLGLNHLSSGSFAELHAIEEELGEGQEPHLQKFEIPSGMLDRALDDMIPIEERDQKEDLGDDSKPEPRVTKAQLDCELSMMESTRKQILADKKWLEQSAQEFANLTITSDECGENCNC